MEEEKEKATGHQRVRDEVRWREEDTGATRWEENEKERHITWGQRKEEAKRGHREHCILQDQPYVDVIVVADVGVLSFFKQPACASIQITNDSGDISECRYT